MNIEVKMTTATELCQIHHTGLDENKASATYMNEQKVITKNSKGAEVFFHTPIYTGNGIRGKLRRFCFEILIEKSLEKGFYDTLDAKNFHLMEAGGGNDLQSQNFEVEDKVRKLNPLISLFGTSLAIKGKLVTPTCIPYKSVGEIKEYYTREDENGSLHSSIYCKENQYKLDGILDGSKNSLILSDEIKREWIDEVSENHKARKKQRSEKDGEKVGKTTIRASLSKSFIARGTNLYTSFSKMPVFELTPIERGMFYLALERLVVAPLGSSVAKGYGKMEYDINYEDGSKLQTSVNEYDEVSISNKVYKEDVQSDIEAFNAWLDNEFNEESFNVFSLMSNG